jgi:hypothetical protein
MPKVGEEEFDYTPEGIAEAKAESLRTGQPMISTDARSRTEMYALGGKVDEYKHGGKTHAKKYRKGGKCK